MGVTVRQGSVDPARFTDGDDNERRFERIFSELRQTRADLTSEQSSVDGQIETLRRVLDGRPNSTDGSADRTVHLNGSQGVRGTRQQAAPTTDEPFTEWQTALTFTGFTAPPVIVITPETTGGEVVTTCVHNVTATDAQVILRADLPVGQMRFHFQAWGDA